MHEHFSGLSLDAQSLSAAKLEVQALYLDPSLPLPRAPGFTFRDYVVAEHSVRSSARGEESSRWWLERMQTLPAALSLPMRSSHPSRRARMNCTALRLSAAQWPALSARARLLGLSPSALFSEPSP